MTQREDLVVTLRTVADNAGATQTQNALQGVSRAADQSNTSLRRAGQTAREGAEGFRIGAEDILRFAGALTGLEIGLSLFTTAGETVRETIKSSIEAQAESERVTRATAASYGAAADQFQKFAASLSQQTGFTSQSILEAALSARTLSSNYGLTIEQTQKLIAVSADLAQIRGIGVAESFERIQSAIRGEAEASEFLGLTLNATFLQQHAANGAYRETFNTLNDSQKAQIVYNEVLRQTSSFQGLAAASAGGLDGAMTRANTAGNRLQVTLGKLAEPTVVTAFQAQARAADDLALAITTLGKTRDKEGVGGALLGAAAFLPNFLPGADIVRGIGQTLQDLAQPQREAIASAQQTAIQTRQLLDAQADIQSQLESAPKQQTARAFSILNEQLKITHSTLAQIAQDINDLGTRSGQLATIQNALNPNDVAGRTVVGAQQALQQIDAQISAQRSLLAIAQEVRREQEATKVTDPRDVAGANQAKQRLDILKQLLPAEQALTEAQRQRSDLQLSASQLQGQEALLTLTILPQRQEIARLEQQIADSVDKQIQLRQRETLLLAQQAALRPDAARDDTQAQIQRDQLLLKVRGIDPEERSRARREIRDLTRNVLPGQELAAFDADRQVTAAQRQQQATDIATQLRQIPLERTAQTLRDAAQSTEQQIQTIQQQAQQIQLLSQVADAVVATRQQAIQVVVNGAVEVITSGTSPTAGTTISEAVSQKVAVDVADQLREGLGQMQLPPAVQQSGVRR